MLIQKLFKGCLNTIRTALYFLTIKGEATIIHIINIFKETCNLMYSWTCALLEGFPPTPAVLRSKFETNP